MRGVFGLGTPWIACLLRHTFGGIGDVMGAISISPKPCGKEFKKVNDDHEVNGRVMVQ
jgi:hypothetical protein